MKKCLKNGYIFKVNSLEDHMFLPLFDPGFDIA